MSKWVTYSTASISHPSFPADTVLLPGTLGDHTWTPAVPLGLMAPETFTINVTAMDPAYQRIYTLVVTRQRSTDSSLSGITSTGGTLSPAFDPGILSYEVLMPWSIVEANITVGLCGGRAAGDPFCGSSFTIGRAGHTVLGSPIVGIGPYNVSEGTAESISIHVTAMDGSQTTYTITLRRKGNANCDLASIAVTNFTLVPAFEPNRTFYTLSVANCPPEMASCVSSDPSFLLPVTYTTQHPHATMEIVYRSYQPGNSKSIANTTAVVSSGVAYPIAYIEQGTTTVRLLTFCARHCRWDCEPEFEPIRVRVR